MKIKLFENRNGVFLKAYFPADPAGSAGPADSDASGAAAAPRPAAVICPGGGYRIVGTTEGAPVAERFAAAGYAAFVLHYSVGDFARFDPAPGKGFAAFGPVLDLAEAMRVLRGRADEFGIDENKIVLAGFSAGGHLAAAYTLADSAAPAVPKELLPRALALTYAMGGGADSGGSAALGAGYEIAAMPYREDGAEKAVPVFFHHAKDDAMVPFVCSERLDARLSQEGIAHTFLREEHGVHARPFEAGDAWFGAMLYWLEEAMQL
ncbi:MAG: alpha/beta hydrolase [Clostridiales Family XIII bacterium]|jgi:acetyl esterase/lipase|nr:alpha/beta hydrolase [Clostridiales Family XIII bacterium]